MRIPSAILTTVLAIAAFAPASGRAENSVRYGDLALHYSAIPSTLLTPEIARQVQVTRSANRALVNVAIRRGAAGADAAVPAKVTIAATNLAGQRVALRVREVREGSAIYYLAEARFAGQESLTFDVVAVAADRTMKVSFRQDFFPP